MVLCKVCGKRKTILNTYVTGWWHEVNTICDSNGNVIRSEWLCIDCYGSFNAYSHEMRRKICQIYQSSYNENEKKSQVVPIGLEIYKKGGLYLMQMVHSFVHSDCSHDIADQLAWDWNETGVWQR